MGLQRARCRQFAMPNCDQIVRFRGSLSLRWRKQKTARRRSDGGSAWIRDPRLLDLGKVGAGDNDRLAGLHDVGGLG